MKFVKRIIALISVLTIVFSFVVVPASASEEIGPWTGGNIPVELNLPDGGGAYDPHFSQGSITLAADLADWAVHKGAKLANSFANIFGLYTTECPMSEEMGGYHNWVQGYGEVNGQIQPCYICEYCHQTAALVGSEAYSNTVDDMPVNGIDSAGVFLWYPDYRNIQYHGTEETPYLFSVYGSLNSAVPYALTFPISLSTEKYDGSIFADSNMVSGHYIKKGYVSSSSDNPRLYWSFKVPVSGTYELLESEHISGIQSTNRGFTDSFSMNYKSSRINCSAGDVLTMGASSSDYAPVDVCSNQEFTVVDFIAHYPIYAVTPTSVFASSLYVPDTRPASITGDYGILGDNNQLAKIDSQTIVNETDNSVYNPVTNTTSNVDNWQFDYSTRTYDLTLDTGDKMSVTYGDEYVTIQEGDTVYNVYYIIQQEETSPSVPAGHKHNYTSTITREPSCTTKGITTYTCEECGNTYQENTSALGHDWVIKEQIPTVYGETGEVETSGYTIYECTRCHETYKSTDGTVPDSGGGGELAVPDMTGELGSYWERVKGFFIALPEMFGDLTKFLHEGWSYVPDEVMTLIEFGLSMVVLVGTINWIFKR